MASGLFGADVHNGLKTREKKPQKRRTSTTHLRVEAPGLALLFEKTGKNRYFLYFIGNFSPFRHNQSKDTTNVR